MSPSYFFDEMDIFEAEQYLEGAERASREAWEQTRMLMYAVIQVNSKEELEPQDVLRFRWDEEDEEESEEDREKALQELRERAKRFENE